MFIPNRSIRSSRNDLKWMTDRLKHLIWMKRGIYKRFKSGETDLKTLNQYFLSVFMQENLTTVFEADQVFREREDQRLTNINITSQQVFQEIDKLRIN